MKDFYGDNVRWFIGLVVNHTPPPGFEGRVKVRIRGIHSPSTNDIPECDLPWAQVLIPGTEQGVSGLGRNTKITSGATVFGMFADGDDSQIPIVIGSLTKKEFDNILSTKFNNGSNNFPLLKYEDLLTTINSCTRTISNIIVHWTQTPSNKNTDADELDFIHKNAGYDSIQYHFVVLRDGSIQSGLNINKPGYDGATTISIVLVGGLNCPSDTPNPERFISPESITRSQYNSLEKIVRQIFEFFPTCSIDGSEDVIKVFDVKKYAYAIFRRN